MKKLLPLLALLMLCSLSGCAGVLLGMSSVAEDERKIGTYFSDKAIEAEIANAYCDDDLSHLRHITPYAFFGRVYLVGEYETEQEKERALAIARGVAGVQSVESYLLPKEYNAQCPASRNLALALRVKSRLLGDEDTAAARIHVESTQCRILLLGIADSQQEIDAAIADARAVDGVQEVISCLSLLPGPPAGGSLH